MKIRLVYTVIFLLLASSYSYAHSTKGRIKIDLTKSSPTIDDFAYFCEPYVTHKLFKNKFKKWRMRFFLKSFDSIKLDGNMAFINVTLLDIKTHSAFKKVLFFERDKRGKWFFKREDNSLIPVFTYVKKWPYYYEKYILPAALIGCLSLIAVAGIFRIRKYRAVKRLKKGELSMEAET